MTRAPQLAAESMRGRWSTVPHQLPTDRRDAGAKPWSVFVIEIKGPMRNTPGRAPMIPATIGAAKLVPLLVWPDHGNPFDSIRMFVPGAAISGFSRSPTVEVGSTKLDDAAMTSSARAAVPPRLTLPTARTL